MKDVRFHEIVNQVDALLVQGSAPCLERAQPLLRELSAWVTSWQSEPRGEIPPERRGEIPPEPRGEIQAKLRGEIQAKLRGRAMLWERLLEASRGFTTGWSRAGGQIPETYTAAGALRTGFPSGRLRVDG